MPGDQRLCIMPAAQGIMDVGSNIPYLRAIVPGVGCALPGRGWTTVVQRLLLPAIEPATGRLRIIDVAPVSVHLYAPAIAVPVPLQATIRKNQVTHALSLTKIDGTRRSTACARRRTFRPFPDIQQYGSPEKADMRRLSQLSGWLAFNLQVFCKRPIYYLH